MQRVVRVRGAAFCEDQWFAEQGFAVLVTDGRGTPGRGPQWSKSVFGDTLTGPLEDQVDALDALCAQFPDLDRGRVGIRGWSYGGALAAIAVIRRPDVFHAAVSGAAPLIHGLADDNVVVAHTLRMSAALLAAGRPHQVLPLSGATRTPTDIMVRIFARSTSVLPPRPGLFRRDLQGDPVVVAELRKFIRTYFQEKLQESSPA